MNVLTITAGSLFILFFIGEFIGIKRFSRRPKARTAMWNINLFSTFLWVFAISLLLLEKKSGVVITLILALLWLIAQVRAHWIPYVLGAPEDYRREYENIFRNTIKILPRITQRGVVPNLYHTFIGLLLLGIMISGLRILF